MSRSGFSLLVGWLTEGFGGEALGSGDGFVGEQGKRGRAAVMRVVNNHLRFDGMEPEPFKLYNADYSPSHLHKPHSGVSTRMGGVHWSALNFNTPGQWKQNQSDEPACIQRKQRRTQIGPCAYV